MTTDDPRIVRQVADQLGNYVYLLVDPRNSMPFYVGKGTGMQLRLTTFACPSLSHQLTNARREVSRGYGITVCSARAR